ncbi:hypothetical protein EIN_027090 [Entamoeba invadens IP1]|uniref:hypothetical protein n=1 Tax=Entamoeba invadens IP1 TaxID=370355 RepID=UPI0002C3E3C9|nr:hypothetical protein EIN_027090 [Entamoeba invadens IP1]ELP90820.1 hypothetical protein EIN_027090 [Entamoeba invadens IP1]|eukprot:XP_004257591.1 hypothetical protein EIN_027090 [Entamoeba invadens IP1]
MLLMSLLFIAGTIVITVLIISLCAYTTKPTGYTRIDPDRYQRQELTFSDMVARIKTLHARPLAKTSVAIDIPRLVSKLVISNADGVVADGPEISTSHDNDTYPMEKTTKEVVSLLTLATEGEIKQSNFVQTFDDVFTYVKNNGNGDCGTLFAKVLQQVFTEDSLTLCIMKTFTQALFAAAVEFLLPLRLKHSYHDGHTGWRISVKLEKEEIIVKHIKGETSYKPDAFTFEWSLLYIIDTANHTIKNVSLSVFNIQFKDYPTALQTDFYTMVEKINNSAHL